MNVFIKTFFMCLILTVGFVAYQFYSNDSYNTELKLSNNNPIFGNNKIPQEEKKENTQPEKISEINRDAQKQTQGNKKYTHSCYFFAPSGELTIAKRELISKPTLENTILILLKGPTIPEAKKGIYSEIPNNVDLISVKKYEDRIIVNLSSNFGNGGGTKSIENRIKQLRKTIKSFEPNKDIYLHINNQEVEYLGGDGVYIKQPL